MSRFYRKSRKKVHRPLKIIMHIYNKIIPFIKRLFKAYNRKTDYTKQLRKIDKRNHYGFNETLSTYNFTVDSSQVD